jgi:hypothetical protein
MPDDAKEFLDRAAEAPTGPNMPAPENNTNTLAEPVTLDGERGTAADLPPVREGDK